MYPGFQISKIQLHAGILSPVAWIARQKPRSGYEAMESHEYTERRGTELRNMIAEWGFG